MAINPISPFRNMLAGRQARQEYDTGQLRNQLAGLDLEQGQQLQQMMSNPDTTPEQYARAGRSDIANTLINQRRIQQEDEDVGQKRMMAAASLVGDFARKMIGVKDPAQRRAITQRAVASPVLAPAFRAIGADPAAFNFDAIDDTALEQQLEQLATLYGQAQGQDMSVQSTFLGRNGNMWIVGRDGTVKDTGVPAQKFAQRTVELGGGVYTFDPATGGAGRELSSPGSETDAITRRKLAERRAGNQADTEQAAAQNQRALNVYKAAVAGLANAMDQTATGPVSGRLPAVTAAQQTAEGAVAAMAPVLKQLFRASGEGTFTDRDQALLLDMVPKRTDHPEARAAKIQMINQIVEAKLGGAAAPQGPMVDDAALLQKWGGQ